jgi:BlaI family transcriptional regulator, penicillinase repressor
MKTLTKAEEQLMQALWRLNKAYLKDIVEVMPEPKPHQNTVATLLKILVDKGFVITEQHGRINEYRPAISKEKYSSKTLRSMVEGYFEGSFTEAVSFMVKQKDIKIKDLELLLQQLREKK